MSKAYRVWKNNENSRLLNKYYSNMKYKRSFSEYKKYVSRKKSVCKRFRKITLTTRSLSPHKRKDLSYMDLFINYIGMKFLYNEYRNFCIYNKLQFNNVKSKDAESMNDLKQKENVQLDWERCFASDYIKRKIKEGNLSNGIILNIEEDS